MKNIAEETLANIVIDNYQAVAVLEKYDLDFCCKGKRTLSQACTEKGIATDQVIAEVNATETSQERRIKPFKEMTAEELISYILIHHHFYVKQNIPLIKEHILKVANKHGLHFPYMIEVLALFKEVADELTSHMQKEETILFPRIKEIAALQEKKTSGRTDAAYLTAPIQMMEHEHDAAGEILSSIKKLTNNYTPPAEACTTFKITLEELKGFEEDLHKHVHLENSILFPMAEEMMLQNS